MLLTRLFDFFKGLASLGLVLVLLVGVPAALVLVIGSPLPTEWPATDVIRRHLTDGDIPDAFLIKALASVVWLLWAQVAVAILTELVAVVRGKVAGRAPVLPGVQTFAGKLVASTLLILSAFAPRSSVSAAPIAPLGPEPIAFVDRSQAPPGPQISVDLQPGPAAVEVAPASEAPAADRSAGDRVYVTSSGDNWWDVAERLVGDGLRWSEIRDLNRGRTMPDGTPITSRTEEMRAGWSLLVPPDADSGLLVAVDQGASAGGGAVSAPRLDRPPLLVYEGPSGVAALDAGVPYQVVEGDNLWDIAGRHLGDPLRWPEIFERSSGLTQPFGRQIDDPNLIWPDSLVVLPGDAQGVPEPDTRLVADVLGQPAPTPRGPDGPASDRVDWPAPDGVDWPAPDGAQGSVEQPPSTKPPVVVTGADPVVPAPPTSVGPSGVPDPAAGALPVTGPADTVPITPPPAPITPPPAPITPPPAPTTPPQSPTTPPTSPPTEATGATEAMPTSVAPSVPEPPRDPRVTVPAASATDSEVGNIEDHPETPAADGSVSDPDGSPEDPDDTEDQPETPAADGSASDADGSPEDPDDTSWPVPGGRWAMLGSGSLLVSTGLLGLLRQARRVRLSSLAEGSIPAPPPVELADIETVLRRDASDDGARVIRAAVASLAAGVGAADEAAPVPEILRIRDERIEAVVQGPEAALPPPWRATTVNDRPASFPNGRTVAVADIAAFESVDAPVAGGPAPALVTVGGGLLVNLEAIGVLAVDGPADLVEGLVCSIVHELASGPADPAVDVRLAGWVPGGQIHPGVRCGPIIDLPVELADWFGRAELGLAAAGASSSFAFRAASSAPMPAVVVVSDGSGGVDTNRALDGMVRRARQTALPLAVIQHGTSPDDGLPSPPVVVRVEGSLVGIEPYGFVANLHVLDADAVVGMEALLDHARRSPAVQRPEPAWPIPDQATLAAVGLVAAGHGGESDDETGLPGDAPPAPGHGSEAEILTEQAPPGPETHGRADDADPDLSPTEETPEHDIETEVPDHDREITDRSDEPEPDAGLLIRVLGSLVIEGADVGGARIELADDEQSLLTFLALVGPSTDDQIVEAVWPGTTTGWTRLGPVIERLAEVLGPRLMLGGDGRYRVRAVVTDLGVARRWIDQARSLEGERARNLLQLALADVRGAPFAEVGSRHWQWIEDHRMAVATQATSLLMDACFSLCDLAYDAADIHQALWACERAALLDPLQETVVTRRVQLLTLLDRPGDAGGVVDRWEGTYQDVTGRPAPLGPRSLLDGQAVFSGHG
jgi:nucleoid-associated protein YgaU